MSAGKDNSKKIVIRKVKKNGHGHHGGSWKVAYADFVTAMMAFFLLMWLLVSVDADKREEISRYFKRTVIEAITESSRTTPDSLQVIGVTDREMSTADSVDTHLEEVAFEALRGRIEEEIQTNDLLNQYKDQLYVDLTDQGLRIQVVDKQYRPMFLMGSAEVQPYMSQILRSLAVLVNQLPNRITISGHTDTAPYAGGEVGYSNWELSVDRANAARRELVAGGLQEGKILRVEGLAGKTLFVASEPLSPLNRRIAILVLNSQAEAELLKLPQHVTSELVVQSSRLRFD